MFAVGLGLGIRTGELCMQTMSELKKEVVHKKEAYVYYPPIGNVNGKSKNRRGGLKALNHRSKSVPIHNVDLMDGLPNIYKVIDDYVLMRNRANIYHERFFLSVKPGVKHDTSKFFKQQPIGRYLMSTIVKDVCLSLGIQGEGAAKFMTTHGLRATMISLLIASGHSDASVMLRSGHADSTSLQSYHNLRGQHGADQLVGMFGGNNTGVKRSAEADNSGNSRKVSRHGGPVLRNLTENIMKSESGLDNVSNDRSGPSNVEDSGVGNVFGGAFNASHCTINLTIVRK